MTISFSGLASGLDTSSWVEALVEVKQQKVTELQTQLAALQTKQSTLSETRTTVNSLRSAVENFTDAKFGGVFDLFSKNTASSTNSSVFTATADSNATRQSYNVAVKQLATYTKAVSKNTASAVADDDTKLSSLGVTSGSLSVYIDGPRNPIAIDENTTIGSFKQALDDLGIDVDIDSDGVLTLTPQDSSKTLDVGSTTDTTNLVSLFGLEKQDEGSYSSTVSLYKASTASKLTDVNSGFVQQITEGTFTIGDAEFSINADTTLQSLISEINNNSAAQVYAYWDDTNGKLQLTSTKEGASYINVESGSSNFTDVMGLTNTVRDASGNITSTKMYTDAQELGQNAILKINGTNIVSTSNTVTSDISRLSGVTLYLSGISEDEEGNETTETLNIKQDTTELVDAVKTFISAYNDILSKVDEVTATGADLEKDTSLRSYKNTLRSYVSGSNTANGGIYKLLAQLGISTGEADADNLSVDTSSLELDEEKFLQALENDPDSVKSILAGENGIMQMIENVTEQMLQSTSGYFDIKTSTFKSEVSKLETKISTQQDKVSTYKTQLENKFSKMELVISQMQNNYSSFLTNSSSS